MRRLLHFIGAALASGLGWDLFSLSSLPDFFGGLALLFAGAVWLCITLLFLGRPDDVLYRRRWEIALTLGATVLFASAGLAASACFRMGPSTAAVRAHLQTDPNLPLLGQAVSHELGWAPQAPPGVVGQRLQKVDPSREQIVIVGDSIIYGINVDDAHVVTAVVQQQLPSSYQALNVAVSGYSIEQYLMYLKQVLPALRPKVIVMGIFTGNDFQLTGREFSPWGHSKPVMSVEGGQLVRKNRAEECIDRLAQSLLFRGVWKKKEIAVQLLSLFCNPVILRRGQLEEAIARMFDEIEKLARDRGTRVVWVLLPEKYEISTHDDDRTRYISKYPILRKLLQARHHDTLEFYEELIRSRKNLDDVFQPDNAHLTPLGHKILGDWLARKLQERGVRP